MDIHIQINDFEARTIQSSSGIFSGDNYHIGCFAMSKSIGIGRIGGNSNKIKKSVNKVDDNDVIDVLRIS